MTHYAQQLIFAEADAIFELQPGNVTNAIPDCHRLAALAYGAGYRTKSY